MKITITQEQFNTLKDETQLEIKTPTEIDVEFTDFFPGDNYNQFKIFYINGISTENIKYIDKLKVNELDVIVNLIDSNKNIFKVSLDKINFNRNGKPIIDKDVINNLKSVITTKYGGSKLDGTWLKTYQSGFPSFMTKTLKKLYKDNLGKNSFTNENGECDSEIGLINIEGTNIPGQTWSILNYFNANTNVIKQLIDWYTSGELNVDKPENITLDTFKEWITNNSEKLFMKGEYLNKLVELNFKSLNRGFETENQVIEKLTKSPYNYSRENIKQFCSGMKSDRTDGQDIEITNKQGKKVSAQIKPLTDEFIRNAGEYIVKVWNMKDYKDKPVDYIIFNGDIKVNDENIYIFKNENYILKKIGTSGFSYVIFKNPPKNLQEL
jgi:hypothetical protein